MSLPQLTVYITRYITTEEQYLMFIECIDHVVKHLKGFIYNIIVFADNENTITQEYDPVIKSTYNCLIIKPEYYINPEWYAYIYHYIHHPTEYMAYIMDNTILTKDITSDKVLYSVNKYGCYSLCYNECISKWFTIRYELIKYFIPELIELGSYEDYMNHKITPKKISAQGNQMFTSYTNLYKVFQKFPKLYTYIQTAKFIKYEDISKYVTFPKYTNEISYLRDIRSLCDYVTSQCFFYTFQFPEKICLFGETNDCLYGSVITNLKKFKSILKPFKGDRSWDVSMDYFSIWNKMKDDPRLTTCFNKFSTKRQQ